MTDSILEVSLRRNAAVVGLVIALALCVPGLASPKPISRCTSSLETSGCTWLDEFNLPDFNADGDWDDSGERIFDHQPVVMGANAFTVVVPSSALIGAETIARFRISSAGVDTPTSAAPDGEVEDYEIEISPNPTRRAGGRIQP